MSIAILAFRSLVFYVGYALSLIVYAGLCTLLGWMLPLKTRYHVFVLWNRFAVWWVGVSCGVRYRITGESHVPQAPFLMVSNHQSPWETIFLYYRFVPLRAILKIELLRIPFFGWALALLRPVAIDRSKRREARQTLLGQGRQRLNEEKLSVLVFPESTRVAHGEFKNFSNGAAELAIAAGVKIVPVYHNAGLFWPARRFLKQPGVIDVVIEPAIESVGREPRELTQHLQRLIHEGLTRLP
ncbi:MAG: lysophospholipid acyltransferase family protein [Pseudohongiellaceae bacterium]